MVFRKVYIVLCAALLAAGQQYKFYSWPEWRGLRAEVLRLDHYECQHCKAAGRYSRGGLWAQRGLSLDLRHSSAGFCVQRTLWLGSPSC